MDNNTQEKIKKYLDFDPLAKAEELTGHSYKEEGIMGKTTSMLGMLMHMKHSEEKSELLKSTGDTTFSNTLEYYTTVITNLGFEKVLDFPFIGREDREEKLLVYWLDKYGILLKFDTFSWGGKEVSVNGGQFYYNWVKNIDADGHFLSSGGYDKVNGVLVWGGYHDCREAIKFNIETLALHGKFIKPWVTQEIQLHLNHYRDYENARMELGTSDDTFAVYALTTDYTIERCNMLPDYVKKNIIIPTNTWEKYRKEK